MLVICERKSKVASCWMFNFYCSWRKRRMKEMTRKRRLLPRWVIWAASRKYMTHITRKQTLRSLLLSYQEKDGLRPSLFWYETDFSEFDSADVIDFILERPVSYQKKEGRVWPKVCLRFVFSWRVSHRLSQSQVFFFVSHYFDKVKPTLPENKHGGPKKHKLQKYVKCVLLYCIHLPFYKEEV